MTPILNDIHRQRVAFLDKFGQDPTDVMVPLALMAELHGELATVPAAGLHGSQEPGLLTIYGMRVHETLDSAPLVCRTMPADEREAVVSSYDREALTP